MIITSSENDRYTAKVVNSRVEFFHQDMSLGIANFERISGAKKVLSCLALTEKPLEEVLCFYRASKDLVGADMLKMSFSEDGQYILYSGKVIANS